MERDWALPFDGSFLPGEDAVADSEKEGDDGGEKNRHDRERGEDFVVFGPALSPLEIPAEARFYPDGFGDDKGDEGGAEAHEEANENVRERGGNGDTENEETLVRAEGASDIEV